MRKDIIDNKDLILQLIANNEPKSEICRQLKCKHDTLNSYLKKMGIEYSGNQGLKGKVERAEQQVHASEYIGSNKRISSHNLRLRLLRDGVFEHICSECKNTEWNSKPIPLELDHINGNHYDNELSNLRLLCPNCHAQTDTYCGKNKKYKSLKPVSSKPTKSAKITTQECKFCKKEFTNKVIQTYCSRNCSNNASLKVDIDVENLRELIWTYPITKVAEILGISDSAVHKRCKKYNIKKPETGHWLKTKNKTSK